MIYLGASFLQSVVGLSRPNASIAFSAFVAGIAAGRLGGSRIRARGEKLFVPSICLALTGFLLFWATPTAGLSVTGLLLAGLGMSNLTPLSASAALGIAMSNTDTGAARVALVLGVAALVFPFALGSLADLVGLRYAYCLVVPLLGLALASKLTANGTGDVPR
jgi:hypothetical protein